MSTCFIKYTRSARLVCKSLAVNRVTIHVPGCRPRQSPCVGTENSSAPVTAAMTSKTIATVRKHLIVLTESQKIPLHLPTLASRDLQQCRQQRHRRQQATHNTDGHH